MNGFIIQNSNDDKERVIKKTSQYLKKLLSGKLAIAANMLADTCYMIEVGSYEEVYYRTPSGSFYPYSPVMSFGMGFGMPYMGMGLGYPMYYDPFYAGFPGYYYPYVGSSVRSVSATYFQSLLRTDDFSHIEGRIGVSMRERINDFETKVLKGVQPELMNINGNKRVVLLGYYSKSSRTYKVVEFLR
jgi:hypothetical protein